jgi:hypothetical protein
MSLYFPQLSSGAVTQYPLSVRRGFRTIVNQTIEARQIKFADVSARTLEWRIQQDAVTGAEWSAIEALFTACEGRLRTFTFLDPADNLLRYSEDLARPVWTNSPSLAMTPAAEDPFGTSRATRIVNQSGAPQRATQAISAPGRYQYSFSVWVRSAGFATPVRLLVIADGSFAEKVYVVDGGWRRLSLPATLNSDIPSVSAAIEVAGTASIEVFGFQLEAQPSFSSYKPTTAFSGIYGKSRFASDVLTQQTSAPDVHTAVCRILAVIEDPNS